MEVRELRQEQGPGPFPHALLNVQAIIKSSELSSNPVINHSLPTRVTRFPSPLQRSFPKLFNPTSQHPPPNGHGSAATPTYSGWGTPCPPTCSPGCTSPHYPPGGVLRSPVGTRPHHSSDLFGGVRQVSGLSGTMSINVSSSALPVPVGRLQDSPHCLGPVRPGPGLGDSSFGEQPTTDVRPSTIFDRIQKYLWSPFLRGWLFILVILQSDVKITIISIHYCFW